MRVIWFMSFGLTWTVTDWHFRDLIILHPLLENLSYITRIAKQETLKSIEYTQNNKYGEAQTHIMPFYDGFLVVFMFIGSKMPCRVGKSSSFSSKINTSNTYWLPFFSFSVFYYSILFVLFFWNFRFFLPPLFFFFLVIIFIRFFLPARENKLRIHKSGIIFLLHKTSNMLRMCFKQTLFTYFLEFFSAFSSDFSSIFG